MYILDGYSFDTTTSEGQNLLRAAYNAKQRPLCSCNTPAPEMYIAMVQGRFIVKRMPSTGTDHAIDCTSFLPPEELSGLSQIQGTAIDESPDDGTTRLKLDFSLSKRGSGRAPPVGDGEPAAEATAPPRKLTLTSLLHYLWHEADLVKWVPRMEGKRWWGTVHNTLKAAASDKVAKNQPIAAKLFVPEPYKMENKAAIAARRNAFFNSLNQTGKSTQQLGILIAEYKSHVETRMGARFVFKQMPDCNFFADADLVKQFNKKFEDQLQFAEMVPDTHVMMIATFSMAKAGYPILQEIGMMLTTKNWIPFEHTRDLEVINAVTNSKRWFMKSMRFNLSSKTPIASMVLTDTSPPTAMFVSSPTDTQETIAEMVNLAEDGVYPAWLWIDAEEHMPDLPL